MADFRPSRNLRVTVTLKDPASSSGFFEGTGLAGDEAVRAYQFNDSKGTPLVALWSAEIREAGPPVPATVTIGSDRPIAKITAYDPMTGSSLDLPFQSVAGGVVLNDFLLEEWPELLTLTPGA
jgi:hypothetical protein